MEEQVDDEKNVLRSLERTFLDEEYEILAAPSGSERFAVMQDVSAVQVVISDYREAGNLFSLDASECIGIPSSRALPEAVNVFISRDRGQEPESGLLLINGFKTL
jgi:hypothetical protein